jgi:hypothetical protein
MISLIKICTHTVFALALIKSATASSYLRNSYNYLLPISSVEYKATIEHTLSAQLIKKENISKDKSSHFNDITYKATGSFYSFEINRHDAERKYLHGNIYCFDGEYDQLLNKVDYLLGLKKGEEHVHPEVMANNSFLWPYEFVVAEAGAKRSYTIGFEQIKDEQRWVNLFANAEKLPKEIISGEEYVVYNIVGGLDDAWEMPFTYKVYFSQKHPEFPMIIKRVTSKGIVIGELKIDEIKIYSEGLNGKKIPYISQLTFCLFNEHGELYRTSKSTVTGISFNKTFADDDFTIDPGSAAVKNIYDVDNKKYIRVNY